MKENVPAKLIRKLGGAFSKELGINLSKGEKDQIFRWFLASILFGTRITEKIVINTYREFKRRGVLSPDSILRTGWDGLVEILDSGGYVRYDFKTATKLLEICGTLKERYGGDLNRLHDAAHDSHNLEEKLKGLGKGIGEVTVNIFLRELRGIWNKANPLPQDLAILSAKNLGLVRGDDRKRILADWGKSLQGEVLIDFESSLVRLGKGYCRKSRCNVCPMKEDCTV